MVVGTMRASEDATQKPVGQGPAQLPRGPLYRFDRFALDPHNRQLKRDDQAIELNPRYLDALVLLVEQPNALISKERFLAEAWRGVPVTDEALTQCIKTLRRHLGDEAANPRFIETVFKHGYRFIAPVEVFTVSPARPPASLEHEPRFANTVASLPDRFALFRLGIAGTMGGSLAGLIGGLIYGFAAASQDVAPQTGGLSVMLVVLCLTFALATIGGSGVSWGIAAINAFVDERSLWNVIGGAVGGFIIGAMVKLIGLDAFNLLFGRSPGHITGGPEGACLGAAVGLGVWVNSQLKARALGAMAKRRLAVVALVGMTIGALIPLAGGILLSGSLVSLDQHFPNSRLRLDTLWLFLGENHFGPLTQSVTGALEGGLFATCVVGAMSLCRRYWR
ncbi:transcriptional regulator [Asticcacaulis sp. 201]|uniref:winged helix-turn-helix domain-containing protein n=1 Tax=Asticcacaulis sp. 201 TaxID=3028787 RepID=UPI0029166DAB|nr:transcriptional regulator [Asticcacaulis sp. 201]MDV6329931.1 transcriptional regulator [Asticcacaulis sp. 201]